MEIFGFYFNAILIGSSILLLIGIILMILGFFKNTFTIGIILSLVAGAFGFGILASLVPVTTDQYEVEAYEVAFTTATVTLAFDDYAEIFYDAKTYNVLKNKENCQVYYSNKLNSYGYAIETPQLVIDKRYE